MTLGGIFFKGEVFSFLYSDQDDCPVTFNLTTFKTNGYVNQYSQEVGNFKSYKLSGEYSYLDNRIVFHGQREKNEKIINFVKTFNEITSICGSFIISDVFRLERGRITFKESGAGILISGILYHNGNCVNTVRSPVIFNGNDCWVARKC